MLALMEDVLARARRIRHRSLTARLDQLTKNCGKARTLRHVGRSVHAGEIFDDGPAVEPARRKPPRSALSFGSGLSIPIDRLRQFTQDIVPLLPAHHLGHVPMRAVGVGDVGFRSTIAKRRQALCRSAPAALVSDRGATKARCTVRILPTVGRRTERRRHASVREAIYSLAVLVLFVAAAILARFEWLELMIPGAVLTWYGLVAPAPQKRVAVQKLHRSDLH
jgi:hypothetical protein